MRKKFISIMVLSLIGLFILGGCAAEDESKTNGEEAGDGEETENVENTDTFKVGLEAGYAPFNWTQLDDANGGVPIQGSKEFAGGYDVQIAKKIADGLGRELEIVKIGWDGLVPSLNSGMVDAIIAGMSPTAERKESIDFSENYYNSDLVMVVKKGGEYEDAKVLDDFSGANITAQLNTFHYSVIDQIDGVNKDTAMSDFPAMRVALESGIIDGYVSERPEGVSASAANDNFYMVEFEEGFEASEEDTAVAVGLKKGSDLIDDINEIVEEISQEERQEIMDDAILNQPSAN
ncbi:MAG: transporter substrate-binding domain-containing protein [Tissierella sp.]|uniref:transporter substrate-binding domain-containing protein n=1 Tax=Tissierella sp. TaxID=41274 RepID=UPI003F9D935D